MSRLSAWSKQQKAKSVRRYVKQEGEVPSGMWYKKVAKPCYLERPEEEAWAMMKIRGRRNARGRKKF